MDNCKAIGHVNRSESQIKDLYSRPKMVHTFGKNLFTYEFRDRDPSDNIIYKDVMYEDTYYSYAEFEADLGELYFYINWDDEKPDIIVALS